MEPLRGAHRGYCRGRCDSCTNPVNFARHPTAGTFLLRAHEMTHSVHNFGHAGAGVRRTAMRRSGMRCAMVWGATVCAACVSRATPRSRFGHDAHAPCGFLTTERHASEPRVRTHNAKGRLSHVYRTRKGYHGRRRKGIRV